MNFSPCSFRATRIATTVATNILTGYALVGARLFQGGTVQVSLSIHDSVTSTDAASMVTQLGVSKSAAASAGTDETLMPIRCQTGVRVKLNVASGAVGTNAAYIYIG